MTSPSPSSPRVRGSVALAAACVLVLATFGFATARVAPSTGTRSGYGCTVLPATNVWNRRVDTLPVRSDSATLINRMGVSRYLHPDFGSYAGYGIPVNTVSALTPRSSVKFTWPDESDAGPYPIPASPKIEGNGAPGDRHLLMVDMHGVQAVGAVRRLEGRVGLVGGLRRDLRPPLERAPTRRLDVGGRGRPADLPGPRPLRRGRRRRHRPRAAIHGHRTRARPTSTRLATTRAPRRARRYPPMGLRLRLKAGVNISGYGPQARVILTALKRYGMILADNGSAYYITGAPDPHWNDDDLHGLQGITGSMFEVVNTTGFVNGP